MYGYLAGKFLDLVKSQVCGCYVRSFKVYVPIVFKLSLVVWIIIVDPETISWYKNVWRLEWTTKNIFNICIYSFNFATTSVYDYICYIIKIIILTLDSIIWITHTQIFFLNTNSNTNFFKNKRYNKVTKSIKKLSSETPIYLMMKLAYHFKDHQFKTIIWHLS